MARGRCGMHQISSVRQRIIRGITMKDGQTFGGLPLVSFCLFLGSLSLQQSNLYSTLSRPHTHTPLFLEPCTHSCRPRLCVLGRKPTGHAPRCLASSCALSQVRWGVLLVGLSAIGLLVAGTGNPTQEPRVHVMCVHVFEMRFSVRTERKR